MTFQEIFNEPGIYVGKNFTKGYFFVIRFNGMSNDLTAKYYDDINDKEPIYTDVKVDKECFEMEYTKVI